MKVQFVVRGRNSFASLPASFYGFAIVKHGWLGGHGGPREDIYQPPQRGVEQFSLLPLHQWHGEECLSSK